MFKFEDASAGGAAIKAGSSTEESIYEKIGRKLVYLLIGLAPIFFLPLTVLPVAINKQIFVGVLVLAGFVLWLVEIITSGKISYVRSWLNWGVAALIAVFALSSWFSVSQNQSFWGFSDNIAPDSFLSFLFYVLGFFLVTVYLRRGEDILRAVFAFLGGVALVALFAIFQFFGVYLLPFDFAKAVNFNTVSSIFSLGIFLALGFTTLVAVLSFLKVGGWLKYALAGLAGLLGFELLLINFQPIWIGLFVAMAVLLSYKFAKTKVLVFRESLLVLLVFIFTLFLIVARPMIPAIVAFPAEVGPSHSATVDIAKASLGEVKNIFLGTGPATFGYDYALHRSQDLNQTLFWGIRFNQGSSAVLTLLATAGILGAGALFFVFFGFLKLAWLGLKRVGAESHPLEAVMAGSLAGVFLLGTLLFLYSANFTLYLFMFLMMGILASTFGAIGYVERREFSILDSTQKTLFVSLACIILIAGSLGFGYMVVQKYLGAIFYSQTLSRYNQDLDSDKAITGFSRAANFDQSNSMYLRSLTQILIVKLNKVVNDSNLTADQRQNLFVTHTQNAINVSQRATRVDSSDALNWSNLAWVYENLTLFTPGADKLAIENYKKAIDLEPKNPARYLDLGRTYVTGASRAQNDLAVLAQAKARDEAKEGELRKVWEENLNNALAQLDRVIELKPDYSPAHILASQVYELQGKIDEAIKKMASARQGVFDNAVLSGINFQLGFLYYKKDDSDSAKLAFERAVSLNANYSNARYFLGLIYSKQEDNQAAIAQFERIEELNPDNQDVKKILANLRLGKKPLEGIVPPAQPLSKRTTAPLPEGGMEKEGIK